MGETTQIAAFEEQVMRFTAEEFLELAAVPPLADVAGKLELVEGVIVHVSPAQTPHAFYQSQALLRLSNAFGDPNPDGWVPLVELTVRLNGYTVRDPDIAVVRNPEGKLGAGTADDVLMLVEIAYTTLKTDLQQKRFNYARAAVPHYWVVDVEGREVHVMQRPHEDDYLDKIVIPFGQEIKVPETNRSITIG
jgi:Uma2 family endonuclease